MEGQSDKKEGSKKNTKELEEHLVKLRAAELLPEVDRNLLLIMIFILLWILTLTLTLTLTYQVQSCPRWRRSLQS